MFMSFVDGVMPKEMPDGEDVEDCGARANTSKGFKGN